MRHLILLAALTPIVAPALPAQSVSNSGLAFSHTPIVGANGDFSAFVAPEAAQSVDLSGDGDLLDGVLFVHRSSTATNVNSGIAVFPGPSPQRIVVGDRLIVGVTREGYYGPGGTDLNGDGDATDRVPAVYDTLTGRTIFLRSSVSASAFGPSWSPTAGPRVLFGAYEFTLGVDLNGDGDVIDEVLQRWDVGSGSPRNLGLAVAGITVGRGSALFTVREFEQGADFNADGDQSDQVVHAIDFATGTISNLGIASVLIRNDGDLFAFVGDEASGAPGTDWNGDSDSDDRVLFAYIGPSGTLRNLASPVDIPSSSAGAYLTVQDYLIAWGARESHAGTGVDWNLDGDRLDLVVHTHNARSGITRNLGLATAIFPSTQPQISGDRIAFLVNESSQGGADRNGDGDAADEVVTIFDSRTTTVTNIGLARSALAYGLRIEPDFAAFIVDELAQGQQDLNGDGQVTQAVVGTYRFANGATVVLPNIAVSNGPFSIVGTHVVFLADEAPLGLDFNGDGDTFDPVLTSWNSLNGVIANHGVAGNGTIVHTRTTLIFPVAEGLQGNSDLNGDLDMWDNVAHLLRF